MFSVFPGAGKTTTKMALTRYEAAQDRKAAMISNDLREGVTLADHRFTLLCTALAVVLNGSAVCPAEVLDVLIISVVEAVSNEFQLELLIFKKDCFAMGDDE